MFNTATRECRVVNTIIDHAIYSEAETRRHHHLLALHRAGARFDSQPAWRFFSAHNADGAIECYRKEFSTLLELMVDWRFQHTAIRRMMKGTGLQSAICLTQDELDAHARKRVLSYLYRPCKETVAA